MTSSSPTWGELRAAASRRLAEAVVVEPAQEARWIVEEVAGVRGADLVAEEIVPAPALAVTRVDSMVRRRVAGEPLQYVLGAWSFRGIDLFVDPRVLVPENQGSPRQRVVEVLVTVNVSDVAAPSVRHIERNGRLRPERAAHASDQRFLRPRQQLA